MIDATKRDTFCSGLYFRVCCFVLFFVAASASFSGYYQKWHFAEADMPGDDSWASIEQMLDGTAHRPSVYRQLLPAAANWLDRTLPPAAKAPFQRWQSADDEKLIYAISTSPTANNPQYAFRYLLMYCETFLFAFLAVYAMYFACTAAGISYPGAMFAPVVLILLMPYIMTNGGFFYDYPELTFFGLAVWISLRHRWWWLLPIVALGSWNKETFLLFVITLYPLLRCNRSRLAATVQTGALCLVSLAVLLPIRLRVAGNPTGNAAAWLPDQLHFYLSARHMLFASEETYGLRLFSASTLIPMALIVWTVIRAWKYLPRPVQKHAQIAACINIPIYLVFCNPGELRNLSMLFIVFLLTLAINLNQWSCPVPPAPVDFAPFSS